ncbi:MAG: bifunctional biotin--[acetyl-CoA-carboxylase] synthetase/biotin operon repressor, partial [Halioglobus sp.]
LLFEGAKLGGVLLEMVGDATGTCQVVIGVGLNVAMPGEAAADIDQAWTDVSTLAVQGTAPGRNALLSSLLNELLPLLDQFEQTGFRPFREEWMALDAHGGQAVILSTAADQLGGIARGVDERGALLLETTLGVKTIYGGEISLRVAQ